MTDPRRSAASAVTAARFDHPDEAHDPEIGRAARCGCGCVGTPPRGAASGWHRRTGPLPILRTRHGLERWQLPTWVDHAYRLRLPEGRWRYVTEPYQLDGDALADLAHLTAHGFTVTVTAWQARHYRGHTVAVSIEHRGGDAA